MAQTMLEFLRQAIEEKNEAAQGRFARTKNLDARRISSALSMAEPEIFVRPTELDLDPFS